MNRFTAGIAFTLAGVSQVVLIFVSMSELGPLRVDDHLVWTFLSMNGWVLVALGFGIVCRRFTLESVENYGKQLYLGTFGAVLLLVLLIIERLVLP
jgi:hypothetical protein